MKIQDVKAKITPILKSQGVLKAAIFGSFVRGEAKKNSDIDILVSLPSKKSLMDLVRLEFKIADKLNKKIDLVTINSVHPLLRKNILKEQKIIYEKRS